MARATQQPSSLPGPPSRRPRLATVRSRVIVAVIGLTALALTIAGLTAYSLERALTEQRVQGYLDRSVEEFRVLAAQGVDSTGRPFLESSLDELLRTAMQRHVLATNESALGVRNGKVAWTAPEGVSLRARHGLPAGMSLAGRARRGP